MVIVWGTNLATTDGFNESHSGFMGAHDSTNLPVHRVHLGSDSKFILLPSSMLPILYNS